MIGLLTVALLFCTINGDTMPTGITIQQAFQMCDNTEDAVLGCVAHFLDLNRDGNITRQECDYGLSQMTLPSVNITTDYIFNGCDTDQDGTLNMADWVHPNRTCLPTIGTWRITCLTCASNGFDMRFMMRRSSSTTRFFKDDPHRFKHHMPSSRVSKNATHKGDVEMNATMFDAKHIEERKHPGRNGPPPDAESNETTDIDGRRPK